MSDETQGPKLNKRGNRTGMAEGSKRAMRDNAIKPGETRNPAGRPPGVKNFKALIDDILSQLSDSKELLSDDIALQELLSKQLGKDITRGEMMVYKQINLALKGSTEAFKAIADRSEGKPTQKIVADFTSRVSAMSDDELDQLIKNKSVLLSGDK